MRSTIAGGRALGGVLAALLTLGSALPIAAEAAQGVDYAFLIDNTGTMKHGQRGAMTLVALCRFVDMMEVGDRLSVFSYGEVARPVLAAYPLEIRNDASRAVIRQQLALAFDANRTDITAGIDLIWEERERIFPRHYLGQGDAVLVLLTDGKLIPVYDDYSQYDQIYRASRSQLRRLARAFGEEGIPIHAVGLGTSQKVDVRHLESIAAWSGGASHHVTNARTLPDVYAGIFESTRPRSRANAREERVAVSPRSKAVETAAAAARPPNPAEGAVAPASSGLGGFDLFYRGTTGAVALFLGLVVIGTRRKQPWAEHFTRAIGPREQRVRGYLKPVDGPGMQTARPIIGIENPGLPTLEIGHGTPYADFARETLIEFLGSRDGTAPTVRVLRGEVTVDGELVTEERKLSDGEVIAFEGAMYMYLRGCRR